MPLALDLPVLQEQQEPQGMMELPVQQAYKDQPELQEQDQRVQQVQQEPQVLLVQPVPLV